MTAAKRNGIIGWVLGSLAVAATLAIAGLGFANKSTMAKDKAEVVKEMADHRAAERPHPSTAVQLDNIEQDVTWIRDKLESE